MSSVFGLGQELVERGLVPDALVRLGIRRLLEKRLAEESAGTTEERRRRQQALLEKLRVSPVAIETAAANAQHYEVPAAFFEAVLGKRLKYSACWFGDGVRSLDEAEERMLELTCERAGLADGQDVLELGCGWGSLSRFMAERYPRSRILAVSNSRSQRELILARGLPNLEVVTADVNGLELERTFDRVVSVEMFEHVRNHEKLLAKIASWLRPGGKLFVHIFCHRELAYTFETTAPDDWMGRHFFTGGLMPSDDLLLRYRSPLALEDHWRVSGLHYAKTARAWLENLDRARDRVLPLLAAQGDALRWFQRWRVFFMSCEELWGFRGGEEWFVSHYRFGD
jgi:cyclopropane-fatty-acyl-phospholipid synthase